MVKKSDGSYLKKKNKKQNQDLISDASREDGLHNNSGGFSSNDTKTETGAVVDQFNCLHMLPLRDKVIRMCECGLGQGGDMD